MNLARIPIDSERDLAIVVATNVGDGQANLATGEMLRALYEQFR